MSNNMEPRNGDFQKLAEQLVIKAQQSSDAKPQFNIGATRVRRIENRVKTHSSNSSILVPPTLVPPKKRGAAINQNSLVTKKNDEFLKVLQENPQLLDDPVLMYVQGLLHKYLLPQFRHKIQELSFYQLYVVFFRSITLSLLVAMIFLYLAGNWFNELLPVSTMVFIWLLCMPIFCAGFILRCYYLNREELIRVYSDLLLIGPPKPPQTELEPKVFFLTPWLMIGGFLFLLCLMSIPDIVLYGLQSLIHELSHPIPLAVVVIIICYILILYRRHYINNQKILALKKQRQSK